MLDEEDSVVHGRDRSKRKNLFTSVLNGSFEHDDDYHELNLDNDDDDMDMDLDGFDWGTPASAYLSPRHLAMFTY
jgi:hypothetical protein